MIAQEVLGKTNYEGQKRKDPERKLFSWRNGGRCGRSEERNKDKYSGKLNSISYRIVPYY